MIEVVIVEDNQTVREGLAMIINATEGMKCVATYDDCLPMLDKIEADLADVYLMDIGLPTISGIEGVKKIRETLPDVNILMLTIHEENEKIFAALCAGANGYLAKQTSPADLIEAIKDVCNGGAPMSSHIARKVVTFFQSGPVRKQIRSESNLTARETEVLGKLADGNSYQGTADKLFISLDTVRFHIRNIYQKLQVNSQAEAVAKALHQRII